MPQLIRGVPLGDTVVLIDTTGIIEAVRTSTWNALTGGLKIETVEECRDEARRGSAESRGYVPVSEEDLGRMHSVHPVSERDRAEYLLADPEAVSMDPGEQDLFAYAFLRAKAGDAIWLLCSADKASIRAAVRIEVYDSLKSLEALCDAVGAQPRQPLRSHHQETFLSRHRTEYLLGR